MSEYLAPAPGGGMMSAEAAQMAASIPQTMDTRPECGDFKRGMCTRGARCKYSHGDKCNIYSFSHKRYIHSHGYNCDIHNNKASYVSARISRNVSSSR